MAIGFSVRLLAVICEISFLEAAYVPSPVTCDYIRKKTRGNYHVGACSVVVNETTDDTLTFWRIDNTTSWGTADRICRYMAQLSPIGRFNGYLASVRDEEDIRLFQEVADGSPTQSLHLGGQNAKGLGWKWSDREDAVSGRWAPGYPRDDGTCLRGCRSLSECTAAQEETGYFNGDCRNALSFVCKISPPSTLRGFRRG